MKPHFDRHGNFWKTSNCVLHVPSDDMKTTVGNTDASEPLEKLSFVEKQTRLEKRKKCITQLLHEPTQQTAHNLTDLAFRSVETRALTCTGPYKCHSSEMETLTESKQISKQNILFEQDSLWSSLEMF